MDPKETVRILQELENTDLEGMQEMNSNGFVRLPRIADPDPTTITEIMNQIKIFDPNPAITSKMPARFYRGSSQSDFLATVNEYVNSRINEVSIFQTYTGKSKQEGLPKRPVVVVTNDTEETRPYWFGPVGYQRGTVATVILGLNTDLHSDEGFFYYSPGSWRWTLEEFQQRLESGQIPLEKMIVPRNEGILVPPEMAVQFPTGKPGCQFVCKTYTPEIPPEVEVKFEQDHVIHFNNPLGPAIEIHNPKDH